MSDGIFDELPGIVHLSSEHDEVGYDEVEPEVDVVPPNEGGHEDDADDADYNDENEDGVDDDAEGGDVDNSDDDASVVGLPPHTHWSRQFKVGCEWPSLSHFLADRDGFAATRGFVFLNRNNLKNPRMLHFDSPCACAKRPNRKPKEESESISLAVSRNKKTRQRQASLRDVFKCPMRIMVRAKLKDQVGGPVVVTKSALRHTCARSRQQQTKIARARGVKLEPAVLQALATLCDPKIKILPSQIKDFLHGHNVGIGADSKSIHNLVFRVRRAIRENKVCPDVDQLLAHLEPTELYGFFEELWNVVGNDEEVNPLILALEMRKNADPGMHRI